MRIGTDKIRAGYPKQDCAEEWTKHRNHKRFVWALFIGWIPYGGLVVFILNLLHMRAAFVFVAALVPYILALVVFTNMASIFRCPRCGSRFYAWGPRGVGHNSFARNCRNCGLRKWKCDEIG
jgi:hypothetical protein